MIHTDTRSLMKSKKKYKEARSKLTFTQKKKHENLNTLTHVNIYTLTRLKREGGNGYLCAIYCFSLFFRVKAKTNLSRIFLISFLMEGVNKGQERAEPH